MNNKYLNCVLEALRAHMQLMIIFKRLRILPFPLADAWTLEIAAQKSA